MSKFSTAGHGRPVNPPLPLLPHHDWATGGAPLMFFQPEEAAEEKVGPGALAGWLASWLAARGSS